MGYAKNTLDLLIGNLWQVDTAKLTRLCQNAVIPLPQLRQQSVLNATPTNTIIKTRPSVITLRQSNWR